MENSPATSENNGVLYGFLVSLVVVLPVISVLVFGYIRRPSLQGGAQPTPTPSTTVKKQANFSNCTDVRDVVMLGDKKYFACLGGVIGLDDTGHVVEQYDMPAGLPSVTVTGIHTWKNKLVVSTQNGIAIIDPNSKQIDKISVEEGLNEGANAILSLDGDTAWVGTFDGVGKVDLNTHGVVNYLAPQFGLGNTLNVPGIFVTERSVYMQNIASSKSSGGVIRYLKQKGDFQVFGASYFGRDSRVDLFGLARSGKYVVMSDMRDVFLFDDEKNSPPTKVDPAVFDQFAERGQSRLVRVVGEYDGSVIFFVSGNTKRAYVRYNAVDNKAVLFMDVSPDDYDLPFAIRDGKMWSVDRLGFVKYVDLATGSLVKVEMVGRPVSFAAFGARINGLTYLFGSGYLWHLDGATLKRDVMVRDAAYNDQSDTDNFDFVPIVGSDRIVMYRQTCGMGCDEPDIRIATYPKFDVVRVALPDGIADESGQGMNSFYNLRLVEVEQGRVVFEYDRGLTKEVWYLDPQNSSWALLKRDVTAMDRTMAVCQDEYVFADGKFGRANCDENEAHKYRVVTENRNATLVYEDGSSYVLPPMWPEYKPRSFEEFGWEVGTPVYFGSSVAIPTSRGVAVFDTNKKTFKAYGPEQGLIGNRSDFVMLSDKNIYSISRWGGLSILAK